MTWPSSSDRATLQLTQSSARTRSSRVKIKTIYSANTVPPPASWCRTTMGVPALLTPSSARRRRAPSRERPVGRSRMAAGTRSTAGAARHPTPPVVVVARRISAAARTMVRRAPAVSVALPWTTAVSTCPAGRAPRTRRAASRRASLVSARRKRQASRREAVDPNRPT